MSILSESILRTSRRVCAVIVAAATLVAYIVASRAPMPLVKTWWLAEADHWDDPWHRRHRMADWLIANRSLIRKTRAEVIELLGEPPPTDYFREWSLVYNLGVERGFIAIDSEWLVLRIDDNGKVQEARIVRD